MEFLSLAALAVVLIVVSFPLARFNCHLTGKGYGVLSFTLIVLYAISWFALTQAVITRVVG